MEADFSNRREPPSLPPRLSERDKAHLLKPLDPLADFDFLQELVRAVNEAQERDAEDDAGYITPRPARAKQPFLG
jgi:hypothetical protein